MRILLITGKGGVGKTTVAAATALAAADRGYRTLITSTDPAHSLADAFGIDLGDRITDIVPNLAGQQVDTQARMGEQWGAVRDYIVEVFDWSGLKGVEAEELAVFPGMDELFALSEVREQAAGGAFDVIVVDCAPTAETLRLLSLPDVLAWYMEKLFPAGRKVVKAVRPVLSRVMSTPIARDDVFEAAERFYKRLDGIRELFADPEITTARLVMNPEKMVINESRRTYTYLGLFGYAVDAAIVNRVLPEAVSDPYFKRWREIQAEYLAEAHDAFAGIPTMELRLFDEEMVGVDRLRQVADELYGDTDPTDRFVTTPPFRVEDDGDQVVLVLSVPFAEHGEVDVLRHGDDLYVTVGPYRRSLSLPDSLKRRQVLRARLSAGELRVAFGTPDG
jgi:arsenite-transporting ATPase